MENFEKQPVAASESEVVTEMFTAGIESDETALEKMLASNLYRDVCNDDPDCELGRWRDQGINAVYRNWLNKRKQDEDVTVTPTDTEEFLTRLRELVNPTQH